jgi:hypothetical protein
LLIQELAQKYEMAFFECSAKTGSNVTKAVESLTKDVMTKFASKPFSKKKDTDKIGGHSETIPNEEKKG